MTQVISLHSGLNLVYSVFQTSILSIPSEILSIILVYMEQYMIAGTRILMVVSKEFRNLIFSAIPYVGSNARKNFNVKIIYWG